MARGWSQLSASRCWGVMAAFRCSRESSSTRSRHSTAAGCACVSAGSSTRRSREWMPSSVITSVLSACAHASTCWLLARIPANPRCNPHAHMAGRTRSNPQSRLLAMLALQQACNRQSKQGYLQHGGAALVVHDQPLARARHRQLPPVEEALERQRVR